MFRLYRQPEKGEFFVVFGDCAQGGTDSNCVQFMSKSKADVPMKLKMTGVAAQMTPYLHQALEWLYDQTGVKPTVALERNNGGGSEMHNLMMMNKNSKYKLYQMKTAGTVEGEEQELLLGWNTTSASRPKMVGDWKVAYETRTIQLYDDETLAEHQTFIVNKNGKPEADSNQHDDEVMSMAGAYQLYQTEHPPTAKRTQNKRPQRSKFHV